MLNNCYFHAICSNSNLESYCSGFGMNFFLLLKYCCIWQFSFCDFPEFAEYFYSVQNPPIFPSNLWLNVTKLDLKTYMYELRLMFSQLIIIHFLFVQSWECGVLSKQYAYMHECVFLFLILHVKKKSSKRIFYSNKNCFWTECISSRTVLEVEYCQVTREFCPCLNRENI